MIPSFESFMITHKRRGILSEKNIPRCPFLFKITAHDALTSWAVWLFTPSEWERKANPKTERRLHYHTSIKRSRRTVKNSCGLFLQYSSWLVPVGTLTFRTDAGLILRVSRYPFVIASFASVPIDGNLFFSHNPRSIYLK
jgi:hypothetical protein